MKKLILSGACALALLGSLAQAQTTSTTTTSGSSSSTTTAASGAGGVATRETSTTTTTDTMAAGTITEFTPGTSVILKTEAAAAPVTYKFAKTVTYVDEAGKVVEAASIRKDSRVRVKYSKVGADTVVDRVIVLK